MTYKPANVPGTVEAPLAQYLAQELQRIRTEFETLELEGNGGTDPPAGDSGLAGFGGLWSSDTSDVGTISGSSLVTQIFNNIQIATPLRVTQSTAGNGSLTVLDAGPWLVAYHGKMFHSSSGVLDRIMRLEVHVNGANPASGRRHFFPNPINSNQTMGSMAFMMDLLANDVLTLVWGDTFSDTLANCAFENAEFSVMRLDP